MKKNWILSGIAAVMVAGVCCGGAEGIINASWLNARVFPELKASVAVKLPRGKKVEIVTVHGAWLEVVAPDITPVFAAAAYLDGNKALRDMNLRIRPAGSAAVIGRIRKGETLKAVSVPDRFGWVQVAPLADMRVYVYKEYVTYDAAKVPAAKNIAQKEKKAAPAPVKEEKKAAPAPVKEEKKAAPAPVKEEKKAAPAPVKEEKKAAPAPVKEEKKAAPAPVKEEKKAAPAPVKKEKKAAVKKAEKPFELTAASKKQLLELNADVKNGKKFEKKGRVVAVARPAGSCTAFALTDLVDGHSLGFIFAEAPVQLKDMVNKEVAVKGIAYKVANWRNPVVAVTSISLIGE